MAEVPLSSSHNAWLAAALDRTWPGAQAGAIVALRGDASSRRFWRLVIDGAAPGAPPCAILIDLGPDDLPLYARALDLVREPLAEPPFVNVHRLLTSLGVAAPEIYMADLAQRLLLVENLGETDLLLAVAREPARTGELYRLAIDQLLRIHVDGTRRRDDRCVAFTLAYDERLFGWELQRFLDVALNQVAPDADRNSVATELDELAAQLGALPRVLSHRDYHGHNLFVQAAADAPRIRVIDFQDALLAPPAQDLAVLMTTRDTASLVNPALEARLLDYYLAGRARRGAPIPDRAEFRESYRLCVLQHALKSIGLFVTLERDGKHGYSQYIPHALAQARRMLAQIGGFHAMRAALKA